MIFLYILIGIIALIVLLLSSNIRIKIEYSEELKLKMYFGIFKIPEKLFKSSDKPKKQKDIKQKPKKTDKKPKKEKSKFIQSIKKKGLTESFNELLDLLKPIISTLSSFSSKIKIHPLIIYIKMAGDDAAKLAIDYGKFCTVYYPLIKTISEKTICKNIESNVFVDYTSSKLQIYFKTQIKIRMIHTLTHSIKILIEFLKFKSKFD